MGIQARPEEVAQIREWTGDGEKARKRSMGGEDLGKKE
jgi:hypothetical protein